MLTQKAFEDIKNMSSYEDYLIDLIYKLDRKANGSVYDSNTLVLEKAFLILKTIYKNKSLHEIILFISQKANKDVIFGGWISPVFDIYFDPII